MENNTTNFATQNSAPAPVQSAASAPVSNKQGGTKKTPTILMIVFFDYDAWLCRCFCLGNAKW